MLRVLTSLLEIYPHYVCTLIDCTPPSCHGPSNSCHWTLDICPPSLTISIRILTLFFRLLPLSRLSRLGGRSFLFIFSSFFPSSPSLGSYFLFFLESLKDCSLILYLACLLLTPLAAGFPILIDVVSFHGGHSLGFIFQKFPVFFFSLALYIYNEQKVRNNQPTPPSNRFRT